jgi:hypothetical protein
MALVSMNVKSDDYAPSSDYDASPCLYLSDEQCKALGITVPPAAGTRVAIQGVAMVQSATQSIDGDDDDPDVRLTLQVTHLAVEGVAEAKNAGTMLYGG